MVGVNQRLLDSVRSGLVKQSQALCVRRVENACVCAVCFEVLRQRPCIVVFQASNAENALVCATRRRILNPVNRSIHGFVNSAQTLQYTKSALIVGDFQWRACPCSQTVKPGQKLGYNVVTIRGCKAPEGFAVPLHVSRQIHALACAGKLAVTIQVCIVGGSCKQCAAILCERGYNRCCALNRTGCNLVNHPLHGCKNNVLCTGIQAHRHVATDVFFVGARVKQHGCVAPYVPCIAERATQISSCNGSCLTFQKHPFAAVRGELFRPLCKV